MLINESKCPYCGIELKNIPTRKIKCPHCKSQILRFSDYNTSESNKIYLYREDEQNEAEKIKSNINKKYIESSQIKRWKDIIEGKGFKAEDYDKLNVSPRTPRNLIYGAFNHFVMIATEANDLEQLSILYYDMALFLNEEMKNPYDLLLLSARTKLKTLNNHGWKTVTISSCGGCESCQKLDGKVFSIKEALEITPIPNKNCTNNLHNGQHSFCRCSYLPKNM